VIDLHPRGLVLSQAMVLVLVLSMLGCQGVSAGKGSSSSASTSATTAGQLQVSPSSFNFGTVQLGASQSQSATLTNSGGSSVTLSQVTASGAGFSSSALSLPLTLATGQSTTFSIRYTPQAAGSFAGNLSVISNAANSPLTVPLSGIGAVAGSLIPNPSSINFGIVQIGNSQTLSETLTNSGSSSVTITQATSSGSGFALNGLNPPQTLTAGQSLTFSATFAPTSNGAASGSISVVSDATNPNLIVPMSGTGTSPGQLTVSPSSINFGNVAVGNSQSQSGTLAATGSSVTISSGTSSSSEFTFSGVSFPLTIAAGHSASFTAAFTPQMSGGASGNISFVSSAVNSPGIQSLSGTGINPPQHSVDLSWNASTSVVVGYNVYRGAKTGGPYTKMNTALDALTSYTDSTVQAGQTYYYVTTAVDSGGLESGYSNEVPAAIPTP